MVDINIQSAIGITVFIACILIILFLLIKLSKISTENKRIKKRLHGRQAKTGLPNPDSLTYKLSPHLLKNALNAIQSHAYQSYYSLDKLSHVLDYILYETDGEFVPLKDELDFALNLIEINRLKTSPLFDLHTRSKIDFDDPIYQKLVIAPFITINPIENAFKHADLQSEHSFISVIFEVKENWFLLAVSNKIPEKRSGHPQKGGLGNVSFQERLNAIYGEEYQLKEETDGHIHTVRLKVKLHGNP